MSDALQLFCINAICKTEILTPSSDTIFDAWQAEIAPEVTNQSLLKSIDPNSGGDSAPVSEVLNAPEETAVGQNDPGSFVSPAANAIEGTAVSHNDPGSFVSPAVEASSFRASSLEEAAHPLSKGEQ